MSGSRWKVLLPLLVVTVSLSVWGPEGRGSDDDIAEPVERSLSARPGGGYDKPAASESPAGMTIERRDMDNSFRGLFHVEAARTATPSPLVVPPVQPPPQPAQPPAIPFKFMGRMTQNDGSLLFLTWGDRNIAVKAGDVIDGTYRLERLSDNQAEFTYLPQGAKQILVFPGSH